MAKRRSWSGRVAAVVSSMPERPRAGSPAGPQVHRCITPTITRRGVGRPGTSRRAAGGPPAALSFVERRQDARQRSATLRTSDRAGALVRWAREFRATRRASGPANHRADAAPRRRGARRARRRRARGETSKRPPREPLRCCPGEAGPLPDHFCHVPRASITPAAPATLTLPTHDLVTGAAVAFATSVSVADHGAGLKGFRAFRG